MISLHIYLFLNQIALEPQIALRIGQDQPWGPELKPQYWHNKKKKKKKNLTGSIEYLLRKQTNSDLQLLGQHQGHNSQNFQHGLCPMTSFKMPK
jgi:hypothetical protein